MFPSTEMEISEKWDRSSANYISENWKRNNEHLIMLFIKKTSITTVHNCLYKHYKLAYYFILAHVAKYWHTTSNKILQEELSPVLL